MKGKRIFFLLLGCMSILFGIALIAMKSVMAVTMGMLFAMAGICITVMAVMWRPEAYIKKPMMRVVEEAEPKGANLEMKVFFPDLLDLLAARQDCFISDLVLNQNRRQEALHELSCMDELSYPLKQWKVAIEYLTGQKYELFSVNQAKSVCYDLAGIRIGNRFYPGRAGIFNTM